MRRRRIRRKNKQNKKFLLSVGTALLLLLIIFSRGFGGRVGFLQNASMFILSPFQKIATAIAEQTTAMGSVFTGGAELKEEVDTLRAENEQLEAKNRALLEVVAKEEYLKKEYALLQNTNYDLIPAMINDKEAGGLFIRFTVDRGTRDGVKEGDLVVLGTEGKTGEDAEQAIVTGLVGRIVSVGTNDAKVTGILDETTNLSFKGVRTQKFGVLDGRTADGLTGYYFDTDADVLVGDSIVTSGMSPLYPENLFIGTISAFETNEADRMKHVTVTTGIDFSKLYRVMILRLPEDAQ